LILKPRLAYAVVMSTGWLRGVVKAVPSGDQVVIVAPGAPGVRRRRHARVVVVFEAFVGWNSNPSD